jgi:nitroreductase
MDLWTVMKMRRSVRKFAPVAPPDSTVEKLLDASKLAPSAGGLEARRIFVVKPPTKRKELAEACFDQSFVGEAPFALVFCADLERISAEYGDRGRDLYCIQDVSAAVENVLLRAVDLGLSGCWVGAFDESKVKELLGLPDNLRPLAVVPIGYEG